MQVSPRHADVAPLSMCSKIARWTSGVKALLSDLKVAGTMKVSNDVILIESVSQT